MSRSASETIRRLQTLLEAGTVAGLSDGQLLERFVALQGSAADAAFEAIVARHGPMVLHVCLRHLRDPHEAEGVVPASVVTLTEGMLNAMFLTKLRTLIPALLAVGLITMGASAWLLQGDGPGKIEPTRDMAKTGPGTETAAISEPAEAQALTKLEQNRLRAAKAAYEAAKPDYEVGRITLDRYCRISRYLLESQLALNPKREDRVAAFEAYPGRAREIEAREKAEAEDGRGTVVDVAEAEYYRVEAELWLTQVKAGRDKSSFRTVPDPEPSDRDKRR